ncbi:FOG: Transposon-encoded proteins with TYA, reverse transcriptase, integrase domains in various combinations [Ceraceosorus bombacis]|uniref:FOG: Transposon-encoded proteins with TYA, reverse transcriptase, integrase domains in various combinations n=1 Tax=Ceraceosorus bombacis TaxID=401625 RepID=A0A0P1BQ67_9BASI|nr:FOG: Transposon-encoded proteins with TYA, reverse transcriptase, integrase domains in various combinations [Ceraceosorus bombacis]
MYVHRGNHQRVGEHKLAPRAEPLIFCGYNPTSKGYYAYNPDTRLVQTATDVVFVEDHFPLSGGSLSGAAPPNPDHNDDGPPPLEAALHIPAPVHADSDSSTPAEEATQPNAGATRRSTRAHKPVSRPDYVLSLPACAQPSTFPEQLVYGLAAQYGISSLPNNYCQALASPDCDRWVEAMTSELNSHAHLHTFTPVPKPPGVKVIHSRWVYTWKVDEHGNIVRFKARIVARGDQQSANAANTYAPVASMASWRVLASIATHLNWPIHQTDFDTAYLNAERSGDPVYMHPPDGMEGIAPGHVLRIDMALYGLHDLRKFFKLKDIGDARHILGIHIRRDSTGLYLCQESYLRTVSERFQQWQGSHCGTPLPPGILFEKYKGPSIERPYLQLLGSLLYAMIATRPDLAYSLGVLSRYSSNPGPAHWTALLGVLQYVRDTSSVSLFYRTNKVDPTLQLWCDSDYAACTATSRSTSGHLAQLGSHALSWTSKRQSRVAKSTTEAKYIELSAASATAIHFRELLKDIKMVAFVALPTPICCDNKGAVANIRNGKDSYRTCHVRIDEHFVRKCVQRKETQVLSARTRDEVADIFTKSLPRPTFTTHCKSIGLRIPPPGHL